MFGFSSEGFGAWNLASRNPDVFGAIAVLSADSFLDVTHKFLLYKYLDSIWPEAPNGPIEGNGWSVRAGSGVRLRPAWFLAHGASQVPSRAVETSRLETFADGIFAIAATLLIIDVSVHAPGAELGAALKHSWPQYAAYAVSFLIIGIWWVNHHAHMAVIDRVDRTFLFATIALLACIAFLPFPTRLVAEHFRDDGVRAAAITYGLTMTAAAICFAFSWFYAASGRRLITETADQDVVSGLSRSVIPGVPINAAATLVALWSPYTALALFAALALFYVLGSSVFGRD